MAKTEDKNKEFREVEEKFDQIFDAVTQAQLRVSPGFKDRVLELSRQRRASSPKSRSWAPLTFSVLTLALGAIAFSFWFSHGAFEARVFEQVAIRLDIRSHAQEAQCNVQIELPSGVRFYSKANPEIAENSSLELPCGSGVNVAALPIVLQGTEEGLKKVSVRFIGMDQQELSRAIFKIKFNKGSEQA